MSEQEDRLRLSNLWTKLQKDKNLSKKLDLLEELTGDDPGVPKKDLKRKGKSSSKVPPKKTKSVVEDNPEIVSSSPNSQAGSPEKTGQDDGTSNVGASQSSVKIIQSEYYV